MESVVQDDARFFGDGADHIRVIVMALDDDDDHVEQQAGGEKPPDGGRCEQLFQLEPIEDHHIT